MPGDHDMMDITFWDSLISGLSYSDLEWLEIRIARRKKGMHPEIIARKIIIRKED